MKPVFISDNSKVIFLAMAGAGGPMPGSANMEFKEMKEEATTPPTVEYEQIKAC